MHAHIHWEEVDWTQQDRDIAIEHKVNPSVVNYWRKKLGKPRPPHWYARKTNDEYLAKWRHVDWNQSNRTIAKEHGLTAERVRQIRLLLGIPKSNYKPLGGSPRLGTVELIKWLENHLEEFRGLTVSQAAAKLGRPLPKSSRLRKILDKHQLLCPWGRSPWKVMNFGLSNRELSRIWKVSIQSIGVHRSKSKFGPAKWWGKLKIADAPSESVAMMRAEEEAAQQFALGPGPGGEKFRSPSRMEA